MVEHMHMQQPTDAPTKKEIDFRVESPWAIALRRTMGDWRGRVGLAMILLMVLVAALAPILAPFDPLEMHHNDQFHPPSRAYLFGTDEFGRDLLSRVIFGARISIAVGVVAVGCSLVIGGILGLVAGYSGGVVDSIVMRIQDFLLAFPGILLAITLMAILGPGLINVFVAVAVVNIPRFARLGRASMLAEKERVYVLAAIACGARTWHIVFRSILPNCIAPLFVQATIGAASSILLEAGLSFLGVGNPPPSPSWGTTLRLAQRYLYNAPWYGLFPGGAIATLLMGLYLLDDSLRQAFRTK